jgi:hypothetical protein
MVVAVVAAAVDIALKVLIDRQASISLLESKIELPKVGSSRDRKLKL